MNAESVPKNIEESPALMAIPSLFDDGSPDEIATDFKNRGNECFKEGKARFRDAIECYTKGLLQGCSPLLRATLLCNRAAVHMEMQNFRSAMDDSKEALKHDATLLKAYFRYAKSARSVNRLDEAMDYVKRGLAVDPNNMALLGESDKLVELIKKRDHTEALRRAEREKEEKAREAVDAAIKARGIRLASSSSSSSSDPSPANTYKVVLDETGMLHWPVLLVYPEVKLTDLIADFAEENRFIDHLEVVFEERPVWDTDGNYKPENLILYFETISPTTGKVSLVKVKPELLLKKVLSHQGYVVEDRIPGFFVLVKDSPFETAFVNSYKK